MNDDEEIIASEMFDFSSQALVEERYVSGPVVGGNSDLCEASRVSLWLAPSAFDPAFGVHCCDIADIYSERYAFSVLLGDVYVNYEAIDYLAWQIGTFLTDYEQFRDLWDHGLADQSASVTDSELEALLPDDGDLGISWITDRGYAWQAPEATTSAASRLYRDSRGRSVASVNLLTTDNAYDAAALFSNDVAYVFGVRASLSLTAETRSTAGLSNLLLPWGCYSGLRAEGKNPDGASVGITLCSFAQDGKWLLAYASVIGRIENEGGRPLEYHEASDWLIGLMYESLASEATLTL